jgi:uncharacterized protein (TIGR01777 family)
MTILMSGASGLIGSALTPLLAGSGHTVIPLRRDISKSGRSEATWDPAAGWIDLKAAGSIDAVVHLAGENIAGRWTPRKKACIRDSRVHGTRLLSGALAELPQPPRVLVCASGIGYYGDRRDEILDEHSPAGSGFLAEVCREWEDATMAAKQKGIRVVNVRIGIALTAKGGALGKMLPAFRLGLGGQVGSGQQYWSWIAMDDLLHIFHEAIVRHDLSGPINAVSPNAIINQDFTSTLRAVLRRPTPLALPAFVIKLLLGEMGKATLLCSTRVTPAVLERIGFRFQFPKLEPALRHLLQR